MTITVFVPRDAAALAVGADKVAAAIEREAASRGHDVHIVRNGSRGMLWLEVLVEVRTDAGRVAYGPVKASMSLTFRSGFSQWRRAHPRPWPDRGYPFFQRPDTPHLFRCGITDPLVAR